MLQLRKSGISERELEILTEFYVRDMGEEGEAAVDYYNSTLKSLKEECAFMVYDMGKQGVYIVESWIQKPENFIDNDGQETISYDKNISEFYIDYTTENIVVNSDIEVKKWDFLIYKKTHRRLLTEKREEIADYSGAPYGRF